MKLFLTRSESAALRRCISMLQVSRSGFALSLLLGVAALGAAIALGGTAAWLIARASQQPPVLYLTVAATSVRLFGVSRALARYLSRLASHKVALTGMDNLRNNLYDELAAAPGTKLSTLRRGDLMTRAGADVDEVGNVVVKTLLPALVAAIVGVGTVGVITVISPASSLFASSSRASLPRPSSPARYAWPRAREPTRAPTSRRPRSRSSREPLSCPWRARWGAHATLWTVLKAS